MDSLYKTDRQTLAPMSSRRMEPHTHFQAGRKQTDMNARTDDFTNASLVLIHRSHKPASQQPVAPAVAAREIGFTNTTNYSSLLRDMPRHVVPHAVL